MPNPNDTPPPPSAARIRELITLCKGNLTEVARRLGYHRKRLDRLLTGTMRDAASRARAKYGVTGPRRR
jgi:hypothetical protein